MEDLRPTFFSGTQWYDGLMPPDGDLPSAWYTAKGPNDELWAQLLNTALTYARKSGLAHVYTQRFHGIRPQDIMSERATAEGRSVCSPIWEIANELVVALYLEWVLGWRLLQHEPRGRGNKLGDWEFITPSDRKVFVEVKSLAEPDWIATGVYCRSSQAPRLRAVLSRAYSQLPADDRANLVVLVGNDFLRPSFGLLHSDLFAALYGNYEMRFTVMTDDPKVVYQGPSFRDMHVHGTKHRRLGVVAGLVTRGMFEPNPLLYAIHNPYAYPEQQVAPTDFGDLYQFAVDNDFIGSERGKLRGPEAWTMIKRHLTSSE